MHKINRSLYYLLIWLTLTSTAPFIFYTWPGHPYKIMTFSGLLLMVGFFLFKSKKVLEFDRNLIIVLLIQILYFITTAIIFRNYPSINLGIQLVALFIIILFINNSIGFDFFVKSYIYIILAMAIGGVLTFFIHLLVGIPPLMVVYNQSAATTYFLGLTNTNEYYYVEGIRLLRYAGFFDEPGTFGIYSFFAVLLNKIYFNNRNIEYLLIITTAFTFSLAFYILIVLYLFLFYFKIEYLKYILLPVAFLIVFYFKINDYNGNNNTIIYLKEMTVDRLKKSDEGVIAGNNRHIASVHDRKVFFNHPLFGVQGGKGIKGLSFFYILATHGIIGSFFYYGLLIYFTIRVLKLHGNEQIFFLKVIFLIAINFFHRPDFSAVLTLLAIYSMIKYLDIVHRPVQTQLKAIY